MIRRGEFTGINYKHRGKRGGFTEVGSMRGGEGGIDIKGISGWGCVNGRDRMAGLQEESEDLNIEKIIFIGRCSYLPSLFNLYLFAKETNLIFR